MCSNLKTVDVSFVGGRSLGSERQDPGVAGAVEKDVGRLLPPLLPLGRRLPVVVLVLLRTK